MIDENELFMRYALREAERALDEGEVPVGCVIIHGGEMVGKAHNQRETLQDPTAHAEILAITQAAADLQSWRLEDCRMYVTLEPCPMCAGAIINARIPEVYFGATDPKAGCCGTLVDLTADPRFNHNPKVQGGLLAAECGAILSAFFQNIRDKKRSRLN